MAGPIQQINRYSSYQILTIANGGTVSTAFDAREFAAFGLVVSDVLTGATITFQVSHDGVTYQALHLNTADTPVTVTVTDAKCYLLPSSLEAWPYFKIVSASAEGAARTLYVAGKG